MTRSPTAGEKANRTEYDAVSNRRFDNKTPRVRCTENARYRSNEVNF